MTPLMSSPDSSSTAASSQDPSSASRRQSHGHTPRRSSGVNNNYSAPHTPIASAKRPRQPGRRSVGSNSKLNDIHENDRSQSNDHSSHSLSSPVRKMNLTPPSNATTPMSPMHPPKRVDNDSRMTATANARTKKEAVPNNVPASSESSGDATTGSVLQSIFSPVLNFLNNKSDDQNPTGPGEEKGGKEAHVAPSKPIQSSTSDHGATTSIQEPKEYRDSDGDVAMKVQRSVDEGVDDEVMATKMNDHTHADIDNNTGTHGDQDSNTGDDYGHYTHTTSQSVDTVEDDASEEEEEDEFNPYLFIKYLPPYRSVVPYPDHKICLPPKDPTDPPISLVLDLDETLVHCTVEPIPDADMTFPVLFNGVQYKVHVRTRPYLMDFLEAVASKFEVIVFTASQQVYANKLLDRIDPDGKYIKHRMFRESCLLVEGNYIKDLNVLGRNLSTAVLVDNSPHAFGYQVDNGIPIESWFEDPHDTELLKLERFVSTLHGVDDVRTMVRSKFQTYKLIRDAM